MLATLVLLILFVWPLMLCALFGRIIISHMQSMEEVGHQLSLQLLDYHLFKVSRHLKGEVDILVVSPSPRQYQQHYSPYLFILTISTTTHLFRTTINATSYLFKPTISATPYLFEPTISTTPYFFRLTFISDPYFFRPTISTTLTSSNPPSIQPSTSLNLPPLQPPISSDPPLVQFDTSTQLDLSPTIPKGRWDLHRSRLLPPPPPLFPTPSQTDVLHVSHAIPATVRNEKPKKKRVSVTHRFSPCGGM